MLIFSTKKLQSLQKETAVLYFVLMQEITDYSIIVATRPDPTVRPPSRIAKDNP